LVGAVDRSSQRSADVALLALVFVATAVYLSLLPRNLGAADESYFLYEAKRVRDGEVLYRDVFDFVTPLASYAMAGVFWLFGTSMVAARIAMACVHGLTGALLYAASRALGVRQALAILVPLAYLVVCQAVWPFASWHWFATSASAALLLVMVAAPWATQPRWAFGAGVVAGIVIGIQHQKGVILAAATAAILLLDFLVDRRYAAPASWKSLAVRLASCGAGMAVVAVPLLLGFALLAGIEPMYRALVRFPLESYRTTFRSPWGGIGPLYFAEYTYPEVLRFSPLALVLPVAQWAVTVLRGGDRELVRRLSALIILSIASALSIGYFPDVIHIAFIAGILWVAAAQSLEWIARALGAGGVARAVTAAIAIAVGGGLIGQLARYAQTLHAQYPFTHQTAFGRVDFGDRWEPLLIDRLRELLGGATGREIFCYPQLSSPYLTTGARNPTPYQFLQAGVSPDHQIDEALRILEARRVPFVVAAPFLMQGKDPIGRYVRDHYDSISVPEVTALEELPTYWVYVRRNDARGTQPAQP